MDSKKITHIWTYEELATWAVKNFIKCNKCMCRMPGFLSLILSYSIGSVILLLLSYLQISITQYETQFHNEEAFISSN